MLLPAGRGFAMLLLLHPVDAWQLRLLRSPPPDTPWYKAPWGGSIDMKPVIALRQTVGSMGALVPLVVREEGPYQQLLAEDDDDARFRLIPPRLLQPSPAAAAAAASAPPPLQAPLACRSS